ncbi:MAG TPA: hypothetical protein VFW75_04295 [Acetobacteraceae bacterium]|nr:hypothetical protein [Acetobacteraceae bacterium]
MRAWRMVILAGLIGLSGCVSAALAPTTIADRIGTQWGSETSGGMSPPGVPTAAAGGNAIH